MRNKSYAEWFVGRMGWVWQMAFSSVCVFVVVRCRSVYANGGGAISGIRSGTEDGVRSDRGDMSIERAISNQMELFLRGVLRHSVSMRKSAAARHRILVEVDGEPNEPKTQEFDSNFASSYLIS